MGIRLGVVLILSCAGFIADDYAAAYRAVQGGN